METNDKYNALFPPANFPHSSVDSNETVNVGFMILRSEERNVAVFGKKTMDNGNMF